MGTDTTPAATCATPQAAWRLLDDVAAWTNWRAGAAGIAPCGPFAAGSSNPDVIAETRFRVSHALQPLPAGGTRITWAIRVDGPDAETLGPLVTADFPELLAALKALAEPA